MHNIPQNMLLPKSHTKKCIRSFYIICYRSTLLSYKFNETELGMGWVCASAAGPVCGYKKSKDQPQVVCFSIFYGYPTNLIPTLTSSISSSYAMLVCIT